jgi:hypothetical protein
MWRSRADASRAARSFVGVDLASDASRTSMLRRFVAALLLILAASPFTSPFATCNLKQLVAGEAATTPDQVSPGGALVDESQTALLNAATVRTVVRIQPIVPSRTIPAREPLTLVAGIIQSARTKSPPPPPDSSLALRI